MTVVKIKIGSHTHELSCEQGEQEKLLSLAERVNKRVEDVSKAFGTASDSLIMAIVALTLEDELASKKKNIEPQREPETNVNSDAQTVELLTPVAEYLENLAKQLEQV